MAEHSRLSPSASERWINCPISVHLSKGFEDTQSVYAAEGTLAHKLAELKVREELLKEKINPEEFKKVRENKLYQKEMEEYTDEYLEQVRAVFNKIDTPSLVTETRIDLKDLLNADVFGTADCIIAGQGILHVFDFKYGKNVEVKAEGNSQMRLYAIGAVKLFEPIYGMDNIVTHIVQPRMNNFCSETIGVTDLEDWINKSVIPAVRKALRVEGDAHKGEWCTFCQAKPVCREYGKEYEMLPERIEPLELSHKEIAYRISKLEGIDTYLKTLKEFALSAILKGETIPGYKAVEGRSNRSWSDEKKALQKAEEAGYEHKALYEEKPLSLAKIEKLIGKKTFNELLGEFVIKPQGKPTLVKDSDKREAFRKKSAKESFKNINIEEIDFS